MRSDISDAALPWVLGGSVLAASIVGGALALLADRVARRRAGCPPVFRDSNARYADLRWIAATGPVIAGPLADLMDQAAACADAGTFSGFYRPMVLIARAALGRHDDGADAA